ncbi:MAG: GFA family protein [Steroidobacteraceae bacterium]
MIRGSCLCGGVRFEITRAVGPFELCHCGRCRKASGSAFVAGLGVRREDFQFVQGHDLIKTFNAPIREAPPAYCTHFCGRCGSPVPNPSSDSQWLEVPAGLLDDDPQTRPDRHIFVDVKSPWFHIKDDLPQLDRTALLSLRNAQVQR